MERPPELGNLTRVREFVLLGLSTRPDAQDALFAIFLTLYLATLLENALIVCLVRAHGELHKPMYFFLGQLSGLEMCYVSVVTPTLLAGLRGGPCRLPFAACMAQLFLFIALICTECALLASMAYDRYAAICHPLRYPLLMRPRVCLGLGALVFGAGFSVALAETCIVFSAPFCGGGRVEHFFCDLAPVLALSCAGRGAGRALALFFLSVLVVLASFLLILLSYALILAALLRMPSAAGRRKAFSTCAAHLTVVAVHFGCAALVYLRPASRGDPARDRLVAVFYTVVTPLLNPVVYTLRNREVREALRRALARGRGVCA